MQVPICSAHWVRTLRLGVVWKVNRLLKADPTPSGPITLEKGPDLDGCFLVRCGIYPYPFSEMEISSRADVKSATRNHRFVLNGHFAH